MRFSETLGICLLSLSLLVPVAQTHAQVMKTAPRLLLVKNPVWPAVSEFPVETLAGEAGAEETTTADTWMKPGGSTDSAGGQPSAFWGIAGGALGVCSVS